MKHSIQQGFTLIELMIVIAIIGILAAIAIPQYNDYVAQSQITSALAEINGGKTGYENRLQRGDSISGPGDIGLVTAADSARCSAISVNYTSGQQDQDNAIQCKMVGNPTVNGKIIALDRSSSGQYTCDLSGISNNDIKPEGC